MTTKRGKAWKMTRTTVRRRGSGRPRSNKYSKHDTDRDRKPGPNARTRVWVGGYTRSDGTQVEGHYRTIVAS